MPRKTSPLSLPSGLRAGVSKLNGAALDGDFDSARLCLAHLRELSTGRGLESLAAALAGVSAVLGAPGRQPSAGLGYALVEVTDALDRLGQV
jgi:hypothetical protein